MQRQPSEVSERRRAVAADSIIAKRYRIGEELGEGGMAVVHKGWHTLFEQPIAIKILKPEYWRNSEAVARFLDEARSLARLRGVHVPHVLDIGRLDSGAPFMVTELLDGNDLGRLLAAQGPLPVERAVQLVAAACDAVAAAHEKGIVHRDLKPENLFLAGTLEGAPLIKVLDFGVAKRLDTGGVLDTKRSLGSPHYMAPEQIVTPAEVDVRADIWSLGVVLFELLTGQVPFDGPNVRSVCLATLRAQCPPPSSLRPELPPPLDAVVLKCLEKRPSKRFASARALKVALESLMVAPTAADETELCVPVTVCLEPSASAAQADVVTDSSVILEKPRVRRRPGFAAVATAAAALAIVLSAWPPAREAALQQASQAHAASVLALRAAHRDVASEMRRWGEVRLTLPGANSEPPEGGVAVASPTVFRAPDARELGKSTGKPSARQAAPPPARPPATPSQGLKPLPRTSHAPKPGGPWQSQAPKISKDLIDPYPDI